MNSPHSDLGPELRALAQAILDRLDPALRAAAGRAAEGLGKPGRCQQVWCPVCALAALVRGEQHPLLTLIGEHSVTLMTVVRGMAADPQSAGPDPQPPDPGRPTGPPEPAPGPPAGGRNGNGYGYEHIPIVVEPIAAEPPVDSQ